MKVFVVIVLLLGFDSISSTNVIETDREKRQIQRIPLTQCCSKDTQDPQNVQETFYALGFDSCKPEPIQVVWPPSPIYSATTNQTISVRPERFKVTQNLATCPDGFVGKSWTDFFFYDDGSLIVDGGKLKFKPNEFCINQIVSDKGNGEAAFAARACIRDVCNETACLRKCCPSGMAVNNTDRLCHSSSIPLGVIYRNENGEPVEPDPSSVTRDGVVPKCAHGYNPLTGESDDTFYIQSDGRLFIPYYPEDERFTDEYCVDNFVDEETSALQALICFPPQPTESPDNELALAIFPYFLLVSSVFLIATFIVYALIPEIRNIHGVSIMCHVASLAVMYIGLAIIQLISFLPTGLCKGLAIIVHFAFLSTFTWLNVMSFDIWWTFSPLNPSAKPESVTFWMQTIVDRGNRADAFPQTFNNQSEEDSDSDSRGDLRPRNSRHGRQQLGRRFIFYSIYAWSVPFIIVFVGVILDNVKNLPSYIIKPEFGLMKCWFSSRASFLVYLYGPVAVLILSNIIFFVMTIVLLYRASTETAFAASSHQAKQKFRVIFSLFILMGVSWMTEIISYAVGGDAYNWIFTDILNILTGVFIFFIFVCKPNVWKLLKLKIRCFQKFDVCCPKFMRTGMATRTGTSRSTRNESTMSKSGAHGLSHHEAAGRKVSMTPVTNTTQIRDSTQVDSGDEMMMEQDSRLT